MKRHATVMILMLCAVGCQYIFPDPKGNPTPKPQDTTIVVDVVTTDCPAVAASRQLAADRAATWHEVSSQVRTGQLTTVSDVANFALRRDREAANRFNSTLTKWLEHELSGAEETLPPTAADSFDRLANSFDEVSK